MAGASVADAGALALALAPTLVRSLLADFSATLAPLKYPPGSVYEWRDVPYEAAPAHPKHKLDVFVGGASSSSSSSPTFPRPLQPVFLFVHGGAWARGDRRHIGNFYHNAGVAAALSGCVGVVPSYRLSPEVGHPAHLDDVLAAMRWVRRHARRYGGDPSRIILAGHSAGAHLAMLAALHPEGMSGGAGPGGARSSSRASAAAGGVAGVVGISGVYNLVRLGTSPFGDTLVRAAFGLDVPRWREASPVHLLGEGGGGGGTAAGGPLADGSTPVLLLNAEEDFHLTEDAEEFDRALALAHAKLGGHGAPTAATAAAAAAAQSAAAAHFSFPPGVQRLPSHAPFVTRGIVKGSNHLTVVGGLGQPGDPVTAAVFGWVRGVVGARGARG
jgi:hypothetical protein